MALRVLSIDGGGIRGIIPATALMALEAHTGRPTHELFDLVVGTSTGGILALALTCAQPDGRVRSAEEVRSLYLDRGSVIFPLGGTPILGPAGGVRNRLLGARTPLPPQATTSERFKHFMGYQNISRVAAVTGGRGVQGNARYPAEPLERELASEFGTAMMSSALRPVAVVSCDLDRGTPLVFFGGGLPQGPLGDTEMRHAARATSAGPTFFPPLQYTDARRVTHQCVDGGLVANDPAMVGYTLAQHLGAPARGGTLLVSLGTGQAPEAAPAEAEIIPQLAGTAPWWKLFGPLSKAMSGSAGVLGRELLEAMPGVTYTRLQPTLGHGAVHAMDNVTPTNIAGLRRTAEEFVSTEQTLIGQLAQALAA